MIGDILQPTHLLFILVVALLVLGPKRLPEVGRALGRGLRDFRSAISGIDPREDLMAEPTLDSGPAITPAPTATAAAPPVPTPVASVPATPVPASGAPGTTDEPAATATATATAPTPPATTSEEDAEHTS